MLFLLARILRRAEASTDSRLGGKSWSAAVTVTEILLRDFAKGV
jgi:hypothetical protein